MDKLSKNELAAWRYFIQAHALIIEKIEQDLAEQRRVPLTVYDVLIALFEAPERKLRFGDLNKKVVLSKSGLSRLVDRLERRGSIARERSEADRRGAYVALTEQGERELRQAWPIYARGIKRYFAAALPADDVQTVHDALAALYRTAQLPDGKEASS